MTIRALLVTAVFVAMPFAATAQCAGEHGDDRQAMTCIPGTIWDIDSATCIPVVSS